VYEQAENTAPAGGVFRFDFLGAKKVGGGQEITEKT